MEQRILLAAATMDDVDFIVAAKTDASLWPYEDSIPTDREALRKKVIERIDSDWYKQFIIRLNNPERTAVGELHVHWYVRERGSWEIGYCIFPEFRGRGYCVDAARLALKQAFEDWNAHKVVAMCNEHNIASYKVMEKIGMTREGIFRQELPWQDSWADQFFYSILDSDYHQPRAAAGSAAL